MDEERKKRRLTDYATHGASVYEHITMKPRHSKDREEDTESQ